MSDEDQIEDTESEDEGEDLAQDPELAQVLDYMASLGGKVAVKDLDFLLTRVASFEAKKKELERGVKRINKIMMRVKSIGVAVLKDLERQSYKGPSGELKIKSITQIKMPQDPESKKELFDWMREKKIYDRYATVNARSLLTLFTTEMKIAEDEQGDEFDPIVFALPGMQPASFFEDLKFTPPKKSK